MGKKIINIFLILVLSVPMLRSNFRSSVFVVNDNNHYLIRFRKDVSFLNKPTSCTPEKDQGGDQEEPAQTDAPVI